MAEKIVKISPDVDWGYFLATKNGDLCGSRTRVVGMKTRCTNRYTKRPTDIIITNLFEIARVDEVGVIGIGGVR